MLSNLDDQRAVWSQIWAFHRGGSQGQREERDTSQNPRRVTEAEGYLEPAAGPDQEPGAVAATFNPSVAPLHLGEAERGSPGMRRVARAASQTWAVAPGVPPGAAQGGLEPGGDGDLLGGPQPRSGEGQPAARGEIAAAPLRVAPEPGGEREKADPPLVEEPPSKEGDYGAEEAAGRERVQWGRTPGLWEESAGLLMRGRGLPLSRPPTSGRGENQVAVGVPAAAGERGGGRRELRAQPPDPPGNGSCLCCACGAPCRWGPPWCPRGTA